MDVYKYIENLLECFERHILNNREMMIKRYSTNLDNIFDMVQECNLIPETQILELSKRYSDILFNKQ